MLPRQNRLHRSTDFAAAVRRGRRSSRGLLTVHLVAPDPTSVPGEEPPRAGLVVNRGVGGAVVRHRVSRRLRALLRDRLDRLPPGGLLVVRAAPAAGAADSAALARDLDAALGAALRAPVRSGPRDPAGRGAARADTGARP